MSLTNFLITPGTIQHGLELEGKLNRILEGPIKPFPGNATLIQYLEAGILDKRIKLETSALIEEERHHTYKDLDEVSTRLADLIKQQIDHSKIKNSNPDNDNIIGICIPPSEKLIFVIFAILKLQGAYVPFDNSFPEDRIIKIVESCRPLLIISDSHHHTLTKFDPVQELTKVVEIDKLFALLEKDERPINEIILQPFENNGPSLPETTALVLYTSGSSGEPKGVRLSHRNVLNRLHWQWCEFPYSRDESCCFKTALTFVDSVSEIFGPLLRGLPLHIFDKQVSTHPNILLQRLTDYKITRLVLVPSLLRAILQTLDILGEEGKDFLESIKLWICSGEALTKNLLTDFFIRFPTDVKLCNFYGSTEIMGDVTYHVFGSMKDVENQCKDTHVPIGNCVYNTIIYIMDKHNGLVQEEQSGELYIAGHNIVTSYVGISSSEKFVPNPFTKTEGFTRLFKTGDFGHIFKPKNGIRTLFYDGRIDSQIKIRGFRVDLSEIEAAINSKHELVEKAVVLCYKPEEKEQTLVAFIVPRNSSVNLARLDMMCKVILRSYEIPDIHILDEIPLLVNGKIDRQRLLELYENEQNHRTPFDDWHLLNIPEELLETTKKVVEIISDVTKVAQQDIVHDLEDSFYNLGGTSLNSITVVKKLHENELMITIPEFINCKSIKNIIEIVGNKKNVENDFSEEEHIVVQGKELYFTDQLKMSHQTEAVNLIAYSFSHKGDLEAYTHATYDEFTILIKSIWADLIEKGLSFVVRRKRDKKIVGVSLNFDAYDEPTETIIASQAINYSLELLDFVEERQREKLPKGTGKLWHSFMIGTHEDIDDAENVILIAFIEEENLRCAREKNFNGIFTTNTNPLTQQICEQIDQYEVLFEYQVNQFESKDGTHPFKLAPNSQKAVCCWKNLRSKP